MVTENQTSSSPKPASDTIMVSEDQQNTPTTKLVSDTPTVLEDKPLLATPLKSAQP